MESMESCVRTKLGQLGYHIHTKPYEYIEEANRWYRNELIDDFHKRTAVTGELYEIDRMNLRKQWAVRMMQTFVRLLISMSVRMRRMNLYMLYWKITGSIQCTAGS